jgi:phage-related holin
MKYICLTLLKNLLVLHDGPLILKFKSLLILSLPLSTVTWIFTEISGWTFSNSDYIAGVLTCIAIDHIIGSIYHAFKLKDFTLKKNISGLLTKLALCAGAAILFEVIHTTVKDASLIYEYLKSLTRLIVILYPAGSAFLNMSAITNGIFPPLGWINKLKAFNENLDLNKIKE